MSRTSDHCKLALEIPVGVRDELRAEAKRLGVSYSYMAQLAWRIARERLRAAPVHSSRGLP